MKYLAKETLKMYKFLVAGYVGAAAIEYGYNRFGRKVTLEKEDHQQLEEQDTTEKWR